MRGGRYYTRCVHSPLRLPAPPPGSASSGLPARARAKLQLVSAWAPFIDGINAERRGLAHPSGGRQRRGRQLPEHAAAAGATAQR
jgi:hypothetical protein